MHAMSYVHAGGMAKWMHQRMSMIASGAQPESGAMPRWGNLWRSLHALIYAPRGDLVLLTE